MISGSGFLLQQRQSRRRKDGGGPVGQRDPIVAMCGVPQLLRQRHRVGKRHSGRQEAPLRSGAVTVKGFGFLGAQQRLYLGMFFCCSQRQELMLKLKASCGRKIHPLASSPFCVSAISHKSWHLYPLWRHTKTFLSSTAEADASQEHRETRCCRSVWVTSQAYRYSDIILA